MHNQITVALIDDHQPFRQALANILTSQSDLKVIGQGATAESAIRLARDLSPDVMVLDIHMPGGGLAAASTIAMDYPATKIVMLTASQEDADVLAALRAGVRAYIVKGVSAQELVTIIHTIAAQDGNSDAASTGDLLLFITSTSSEIWHYGEQAIPIMDELPKRSWQMIKLINTGVSRR